MQHLPYTGLSRQHGRSPQTKLHVDEFCVADLDIDNSQVGNEKKDPALDDLSSRNRMAGDLATAGKTDVDSAAVDANGGTANKQKRRMVPGRFSPLKEEVLEDDAVTGTGASDGAGGTGAENGLDRGVSVGKVRKRVLNERMLQVLLDLIEGTGESAKACSSSLTTALQASDD